MQIFLTGVNGYLGAVLAEFLANVPEVQSITGIDIVKPKEPLPSKVKYVQLDIRSPELSNAMAGHEVVAAIPAATQFLS
jgi:nucleoside-diphosphate-sugar epimerase